MPYSGFLADIGNTRGSGFLAPIGTGNSFFGGKDMTRSMMPQWSSPNAQTGTPGSGYFSHGQAMGDPNPMQTMNNYISRIREDMAYMADPNARIRNAQAGTYFAPSNQEGADITNAERQTRLDMAYMGNPMARINPSAAQPPISLTNLFGSSPALGASPNGQQYITK